MARFLLSLITTTAIIGGAVLSGADAGYFNKPSFFLKTLILLAVSTAFIYLYLYKANKPAFFLQLYLLTMVIKVLAYCAYNLIMIISDRPAAVGNVVFFMIAYLIFTGLEIAFLYRKIAGRNHH